MKFVTWNSVELETVSDVISRKVISGRLLVNGAKSALRETTHRRFQVQAWIPGCVTSETT